MLRYSIVGLVVLPASSVIAQAQSPYVESLVVNDGGLPAYYSPGGEFVDIPNSVREVTVPAGQAVIMWTVNGRPDCAATPCSSYCNIRPVIDGASPSPLIFHPQDNYRQSLSGSWSTPTSGGPITVKLQVGNTQGADPIRLTDPLTWTLVVFPQGDVPAVGNIGLVVLVGVLLSAGAVVIAKRGRSIPT